jgi:molybdopterin-guanine dinucleotide biosynthesis protein A
MPRREAWDASEPRDGGDLGDICDDHDAYHAYDAVILAGGRAERLGGRDKPGLRVGGRTLLERVAGAVRGARRIIIVGPERPGLPEAIFTRETPPGAGPVPALRAALAVRDASAAAPVTVLLAADLPFLTAAQVASLVAAATGPSGPAGGRSPGHAGAVLVDDTGREQWLTGAWRTAALSAALADYRGASLRGLLAPLRPALISAPVDAAGRAAWFDCDTPEDLRRAMEWT